MVNPRQPPAHLPPSRARSHRSEVPPATVSILERVQMHSMHSMQAPPVHLMPPLMPSRSAITSAHRYLLRFPGFHLRHIGAPVPHASAASESADRHQILRHRRRVLREECPPVRGECRVQAPPEVTGGECAPRARRGGFVPGASVPNAPNFLRRVIASGTGSESAFFLRNCAKNERTAPNLHRIRYSCTEFFCNSVQQNRLKRLLNSMAYE